MVAAGRVGIVGFVGIGMSVAAGIADSVAEAAVGSGAPAVVETLAREAVSCAIVRIVCRILSC